MRLGHSRHRLFVLLLIVAVLFSFTTTHEVRAQSLSFPAQINKSFAPIAIPAGGTSVLSITVYNPNSFPLNLSTTPAAWSDDLAASNLSFASPAGAVNNCGGIVTTAGTVLSLIGGSVPAQVGVTPGSCTVTVNVTSTIAGNHVNTLPANTLHSSDPTGTINVTNTTPASATLQVNAVQPPSLSKSFVPNTIWAGQNSVLTLTIRNNDTASSLTKVSLTDTLPGNILVANSTVTPAACGSSVSATGPSGSALAGGEPSFTLSNISIAANASCTVKVNVTSSVTGIYTNTIPANAIHSQQGVTNSGPASAPLNVQAIGLTKAFSPGSLQVGGTSTLTITLQNPSSSPYTGVSLTDNLPSGLSLSTAPSGSQCSGTVTSTTTSVTLTGGTIPAGSMSVPGTCTITAVVTTSTAASYTNVIPAGALVTAQGASNSTAARANLTAYGSGYGVTVTKAFSQGTIAIGGTSRLSLTITAPADTSLTNFSITDALPAGLQVTASPNPTKNSNCLGSTFAPVAGDTLLTYSGGTIPAGLSCILAVNVTGTSNGVFTNTISPANITDAENRKPAANVSTTLTVSSISVAKAFVPDTVNPNGLSTLTITLTNTNVNQLDNVSLSDTLPGTLINGVVLAPAPNARSTCGSASITAAPGAQSITMSGGTIPAQVGSVPGICTILVDVLGKGSPRTYTNTISAGTVSATVHGTSTVISNRQDVTATLQVLAITVEIVKGFNPLTVFGGSSSTLTIQLSNPNTVALAGIAFTDTLPQGTGGGMSVASPANPNVGTCGGNISALPGATSFTFSGGSLAASGTCSISLSVTMNVNANLTNTIPAGSVTSLNGASNTQSASATLTNLPGASVRKAFGPNPVQAGMPSTLTITIQNTGNFQLDGMGVSDTLPAGMSVDGAASTDCGGTLGGTVNSISLADGILAGSTSCTIVVPVSAPAAGSYYNCIPANSLVDNQDATNITAACDTLTVVTPPTISKAFSPKPILTGETAALTFTLQNPAANTVPLTGVHFTDTFPAGLTLASVPNASQCNGVVTSTSNSITLTDGSIPVNGSCVVTASATAAAGGSYSNVTDPVTSTNGGTGTTASDTLTILTPPSISKSFEPDSIDIGETAMLTFLLKNPVENTVALSGVSFSDTYPFGLTNAAPLTTASDCGGTLSVTEGGNRISLSGASIPAGGGCTVSVIVLASNGGTHVNTSSVISSTNGGAGNAAAATLAVGGGGLSLVKSTTATSFQAVDEMIDYHFALTNTGSVTLYPPYTVDDHGVTVTCPSEPASLEPLQTVTCTATYSIQAADVTARFVTNTATATAQDTAEGGNTITSNESSVTIRLAGLSLIKSTTTGGYRTAGTTIKYDYTLTNIGSIPLYAPFTVTDDHFGTAPGTPFTCGTVTSLPPGGNVTCSKNYTVLADDVAAGSVRNSATASAQDAASSGHPVTSNQASVTVYAVAAPVISKSFSPATIPAGTASTLTFTITNPAGNMVTLTGVNFTDTFPAGMTIALAPDAAQCGGAVTTSNGNTITLSNGNVLPNNSCTVTVTVLAATNGSKNNTSGVVKSTNGGNGNSASATLVVLSPPVISKSFLPISASVGSASTLTFTLTAPAGNTAALTGVAFSDDLPADLRVANPANATVSAGCGTPTFSPAPADTSLTFSNGTIVPDGTCTVSISITPTAAGTFNNTTAAVTSTNGGSGAVSNTATLTADESADLSITKTDGRLSVDRGEAVTYTVTVHNAGPSNAVSASVFDTIPSSLTGVTWLCSPGIGAACTANGSGNISDTATIPAGTDVIYLVSATVSNAASTNIVNTASVIAPAGVTDANPSNNSATDTDTLNRLRVTKTASPATYATVGDPINYSYVISNDGTSTLVLPYAVTDDQEPTQCSVPASLAPAESFTCAAIHAVTQNDLDSGSLTNVVFATMADADGDTVTSNSASQTVTAVQSTGLSLEKSVTGGDPYNNVGDTVDYTYTLKNTGNVTLLAPFAASDDKVAVSCPSTPSLAPNLTLTCTASYTVAQADLDNGSVTNTASATAHFGSSTVTSNADSQTVYAAQTTGLKLEKSIISGDPYTSAGDIIQYTYLLTNTGNVTLQGNGSGNRFTVADDKVTAACPAASTSLSPGQRVTCTASYTVTSGDLGGSVTNQATAHAKFGSTPVDSNQDSQTAYGSPVLDVSKDDGLTIVAPDANITYTLQTRNNSLQDATGLQLVDVLPAGTIFEAASNGGVFDSESGQVAWPAFDLSAGKSIQYSVQVQVVDAAQLQSENITAITNQVAVQDDGSHSGGIPVQDHASDIDQISINGVKSLTGTEQTGSATPKVLIGEILEYSINIDLPTGTIHDLQAVDLLDHGLAFIGCDPNAPVSAGALVLEKDPCSDPAALIVQAEPVTDTDPASENAGRRVTFDFGQVENASGVTQTLTVRYRVIVLDIRDNKDGVKSLKNRMDWIWSGGKLSGEAQSVEIIEPVLTIGKTVDPLVTALGNTVTYTIEVEHTDTSTASAYDVIMTDRVPAGLMLDPASIEATGTAGLSAPVIASAADSITITWAAFPLGEHATIHFKAKFIGPSPLENTASVEWSSIPIDPAPRLQPHSPYNLHSTERRYDPADPAINDYQVDASATLTVPHSPLTGFAPDKVTQLPVQPKAKAYQNLGSLWLEIPRLGVKISIVGVPLNAKKEWDLTWLGNQAGYLNDTAYPTHAGNSVLTGHVYLPSGLPGPFLHIDSLRYGDEIIVHLADQRYVYQVRDNRVLAPNDASIFRHQELPWLTLVTCKDYNEKTKSYSHRVAVGAVLVKVASD
jgi:mucin-19